MLRIRTGAQDGLRWGLFGFVAAVLTLSNDPTHAAPYADIVVDANSGTVLHATNPDARRHPASLTKIMTLYLLFEQLEAGKLKLDSPLKVSAEAAGQAPTKLGLKPGSTLVVEDAIKGMVTRSANDAAVVVAEAIAGSESDFAKLMTRKAQALGMKGTVYRNASGLPDDNQVTTAHDQSILGRAIQERFPRYYKYFATRSFTFRGQSIANHNRLLGKVEGVDGIKTGYINASGFNLVTSVHRGNRYLVAVVMGGSSGSSRDARMRELINEKIAQASIKRIAPMVAEAAPSNSEPVVAAKAEPKGEPKPEPMVVSKAESRPEPMVVAKTEPRSELKAADKVEAKAEPKAERAEPRFAIASAVSVPVRANQSVASAEPTRSDSSAAGTLTQSRILIGSTEPIQPVLVKTLTVRTAAKSAALVPLRVASPAAESQPVQAAAPVLAPMAKPEPAAASAARAVTAAQIDVTAPSPAPIVVPKPEPALVAAKPEAAATPPLPTAAKPETPAPITAPAAAKSEPAPSSPAPVQKPQPATAAKPDAAPAPAPKLNPATATAVAAASKAQPAAAPVGTKTAAPVAQPAKAASPAAAATGLAPTAKAQHRPGWMIQVGAYPAEQAAKQRLSAVQTKASKMLTGAEAFTETVDKGGTTYYRARFAGLDKDTAEATCKYLKKNDVECVTIKN